uniref:Uncharacterized protein n=1 Tax=Aegilops tauschii subsp. strangulata TaxID=200361 RepID=A0A453DYI2_AEGTS
MLQNSADATKKEMRSSGYPFPVWDDSEFICVFFIFITHSVEHLSTTEPLLLWSAGMRLLNNFEEEFSEDIWSELERSVNSNMSQSVVTLASFIGNFILFTIRSFTFGILFPISSLNCVNHYSCRTKKVFCLHRRIHRLQWVHHKSSNLCKFG